MRERWARTGPKHGKSYMPAMISRIIAAEFSFWELIHRHAQVKGEIWLKIRFLTVRFRTVGPSDLI